MDRQGLLYMYVWTLAFMWVRIYLDWETLSMSPITSLDCSLFIITLVLSFS